MPKTQREPSIIDVTNHFRDRFADPRENENRAGVLKAERRGSNVLILQRMGRPFESIDGTRTKHWLTYRRLSSGQAELCEVHEENSIATSADEFDLGESLFDQYRLFC